jgi:hypothetical protein
MSNQPKFETVLNLSLVAIGIGIAYGFSGYGYFTNWKFEAIVLSIVLTVINMSLNLWTYAEYKNECIKLGAKQSKITFLLLHTFTNFLKIIIPAFLIIGGKQFIGAEHIDGRLWLLKRNQTGFECKQFKETPESLLNSVNNDNQNLCNLDKLDGFYRISCPNSKTMFAFNSENECNEFYHKLPNN